MARWTCVGMTQVTTTLHNGGAERTLREWASNGFWHSRRWREWVSGKFFVGLASGMAAGGEVVISSNVDVGQGLRPLLALRQGRIKLVRPGETGRRGGSKESKSGALNGGWHYVKTIQPPAEFT
ncbi:hypothetical protein BDP27DRAFT_1374230 [Rhodocollybia butyracea]|uniref:Uncharacterized protein n=1 Tax=Rhodocollybia butyracea TaxID=206335 RepID=A0A9P5TWU2_9AGAR|nr:hypothetical protein BDP27DRAFT_1374230 [Rhodocollybia butyracea]